MKYCPKCKQEVQDDYLFCHKCGHDLSVKLCASCAKQLPKDARFCPWCGSTVPAARDTAHPQDVIWLSDLKDPDLNHGAASVSKDCLSALGRSFFGADLRCDPAEGMRRLAGLLTSLTLAEFPFDSRHVELDRSGALCYRCNESTDSCYDGGNQMEETTIYFYQVRLMTASEYAGCVQQAKACSRYHELQSHWRRYWRYKNAQPFENFTAVCLTENDLYLKDPLGLGVCLCIHLSLY